MQIIAQTTLDFKKKPIMKRTLHMVEASEPKVACTTRVPLFPPEVVAECSLTKAMPNGNDLAKFIENGGVYFKPGEPSKVIGVSTSFEASLIYLSTRRQKETIADTMSRVSRTVYGGRVPIYTVKHARNIKNPGQLLLSGAHESLSPSDVNRYSKDRRRMFNASPSLVPDTASDGGLLRGVVKPPGAQPLTTQTYASALSAANHAESKQCQSLHHGKGAGEPANRTLKFAYPMCDDCYDKYCNGQQVQNSSWHCSIKKVSHVRDCVSERARELVRSMSIPAVVGMVCWQALFRVLCKVTAPNTATVTVEQLEAIGVRVMTTPVCYPYDGSYDALRLLDKWHPDVAARMCTYSNGIPLRTTVAGLSQFAAALQYGASPAHLPVCAARILHNASKEKPEHEPVFYALTNNTLVCALFASLVHRLFEPSEGSMQLHINVVMAPSGLDPTMCSCMYQFPKMETLKFVAENVAPLSALTCGDEGCEEPALLSGLCAAHSTACGVCLCSNAAIHTGYCCEHSGSYCMKVGVVGDGAQASLQYIEKVARHASTSAEYQRNKIIQAALLDELKHPCYTAANGSTRTAQRNSLERMLRRRPLHATLTIVGNVFERPRNRLPTKFTSTLAAYYKKKQFPPLEPGYSGDAFKWLCDLGADQTVPSVSLQFDSRFNPLIMTDVPPGAVLAAINATPAERTSRIRLNHDIALQAFACTPAKKQDAAEREPANASFFAFE